MVNTRADKCWLREGVTVSQCKDQAWANLYVKDG